jgi:outer membrane receptor protein involved in Fe transport
MLRLMISQSGRHSNGCQVAGVGRSNFHRALTESVLLLFLASVVLLSSFASAQEVTASIVGTVLDPGGAAVSGATITAKDLDRGTILTTTTNDAGAFNISGVPVGKYQVKVEAKGFQSALNPALTITLNQTARLNFQLRVGQATETVEVTAVAPLLQTDTSLLGNLVDSVTVSSLPLSTHNTNQLTLISAPGVITPNLFGFQAAQNSFGTGRPYVNGAREQENNFLLDGMDNNQPDNNDVGYVPAPEAVEEFNLITGSAPADFGNYLGGVVNVTVKSGTNDFHGSLYDYLRRGGLNANSWQNNTACLQTGPTSFTCGRDAAGNQIAPRPPLHYDNFGFTLGGPVMHNKLFFFMDYAESLFSQPATVKQLSLIPDAQRSGDFSGLCPEGFTGGICNNAAHQLFDPASSATPGARSAFANNQIPIGRLNSAARAIVTSPFYPGGAVVNNINQFKTNSYQGDLKIDFVPSQKDHLMGRYSQQFITAPQSNSLQLLGNQDRTFPLKNVVLDETHTFSASLLNDARLGFQYFPVTEGFSNPTGQNLGTTFGIAGVTVGFLPEMNFTGSNVGTFGNADLVQSFHDTTWQFEDTATWTHGRHVVHGGFQAYHYIMNDLYPGNAGLAGKFIFNGQFTGNTNTSNGDAVADFMLGLPQDVQQGNGGGGTKYLRNSLFGVFAQDNWRIKDNLTLNLGLRWELITARGTNNGQDVNFNLITGQPKIGFGYNTYNGIGNFQPRLGLAWQPHWDSIWTRNTVVRAAYGISSFMEANGVNNLPYQNPPFVQAHEVINQPTQALPTTSLSQGFSGFPGSPCTIATLQALSPACLSGITLHLTNPNLQPAVDQQWNLTIQRQLGTKTSVSVGYVGNKIDHMSDIFIFNQKQLVGGVAVPGPFAQPLLNCCGTSSPTIRFNDSSGIQRYNALQVSLEQRAWQGLQFRTNYTWSKCLTNSLGYFGPFGDEEALPGAVSQTGFGFFFQNAYNAKGDYGRCISDAASLFNGYMLYDLPFGKGRRFGGSAEGIANAIIGGWSIASNFTLHTGFALYPHGPDSSNTGSASPRPDCVPGVSQSGSGALVGPSATTGGVVGIQWLNPLSVKPGQPNAFGTCAAGSFRGPGLATSDMSIVKAFSISERTNFQFLTQFINLTNTPIFGAPNTSQGSTFGLVTSSNPGRQVQFGMKLVF